MPDLLTFLALVAFVLVLAGLTEGLLACHTEAERNRASRFSGP